MVTGILLAAGSSERMGKNKMLMRIAGKTPLELSYGALLNSGVDDIIIVVSESTEGAANELLKTKPTRLVRGGKTRAGSVFNALCACESTDIAVIHDAARCLVTPDIINESIRLTIEHGSAVAAVPVRDTMREKDTGSTVNRDSLLAMQTPQAFMFDRIYKAYCENKDSLQSSTDDCGLYIKEGFEPHYFNAGFTNQKLTYESDIEFFSAIIALRKA